MLNNYFSINLHKKAQNEENEDIINPPEAPLPNEQPIANQPPVNPPIENQPPVNQPPANQIVPKPRGNRVLVYLGEKNWGKVRTSASIKLKGLTQKEYISLENTVKKYIDSFRATGKYPDWLMSKPKNANDIRFKSQPQSYYIFSKNQEVDEGYYVVTSDKDCFNMMVAEFEKLGYDTTPLSNAVGGQQENQLQAEKLLADPSVVEATNVDDDVLSIRFTYNNEVINFIMKEKIVKHPNIKKPVASCIFSIKAGNVPSQLIDLAGFMKSKGYNVDQFSAAIEKFEEYFDKNKISKIDKNKVVVVKNASTQTKFLLEIVYPDISEELKYNEMKDFVMFSFPSKGNDTDLDLREYKLEDVRNAQGHITGQRGFYVENRPGEPVKRVPPTGMRLEKTKTVGGRRVVESAFIYGEYDDLVRFGFLLRNRSWDVSQYRNALALLIKGRPAENGKPAIESRVKITRYSGEPDGYKVLNENGIPIKDEEGRIIFDDKKFFSDIDSLIARKKDNPNEPVIKLFYKQKQGIAWLYQRNSAILGDNTGCGKCCKFDTTLFVNGKLMNMEEIWNKYSTNIIPLEINEELGDCSEKLIVNNFDGEKISTTEIGKLFRQKFKGKLRKIKTWTGKTITTTYQHKFLTPAGWSNDINIGDCIVASKKAPPQVENYTDCTDEFAEFLGWQISEGCEIGNVVTITQKDVNILRKIQKIFRSIVFENNIYNAKKKSKFIESHIKDLVVLNKRPSYLIINSKNYVKFLESKGYIFGLKSRNKLIPEYIINAKDSAIKSFLQAYFDAEAFCDPRARRIEITSASKKLIKQLSYMLGRFDIECSLGEAMKCATNGTKIKRPYYRLSIIGSGVKKFIEKIGFSYSYKNEAFLNQHQKENPNKEGKPLGHILIPFFTKYNIPLKHANIPEQGYAKGTKWASNDIIEEIIEGFKNILNGNSFEKYSELKKSKWTEKTTTAYQSLQETEIENIILKLDEIKKSDLQYDRIISVEEEEYDNYIYDLHVPSFSNYVAEGLVCHNTISTIDAAAMRIKQSGGKVLIFTPKATQVQWVNEIENHLRDVFGNVSTDPTSDADWIVLSYSNVSSKPSYNVDGTIKRKANGAPIIEGAKGKNVQKMLDALFDKQWTVVIFDEAHQLKKGTSAKATNISLLAERIPFKWGATATPAANNASDVHNILKCCGHTLGKLPASDFRSEFIGGKGSMKNLSNKEQALLMLQKAHNLNKWLTLSGVYLKRSMRSMNPDIPDHNITEHNITDINFDMENFRDRLREKLEFYGNSKSNVLVQLMAERMTLANQKVPHTVKEAIDIIRTGGKVLIFSCFKTSCDMLFTSMQKYFSGQLEGYNQPEDEVVRASGYKVVQITDRIKNSRGIQAAIDGFKGVIRDRNGRIKEDENSPVRAMVVSALKGGTGVSLENSTEHVLINDFDWMPAVCQQVEGRAYRINNVFPVNTRYMVVRGTGVDADGNKVISPDEKFYNYVRTKISISDAIQQLDEKIEEGLIAGNNVSAEKAQLLEEQMRLVENKEDLDRWVNDLAGIPLDQGSDIDEIIDDLYEAEQEKKGNEEDTEPDVKMGNVHGWYKQAFDVK